MRGLLRIAGVIVLVVAGVVAWRIYDRDPEISAADVPATPC